MPRRRCYSVRVRLAGTPGPLQGIQGCHKATGATALALSAFIGPFPTAHAYYGGSVGLSGDSNSLGCTPLTFAAGPGAPVWVVVGSPGAARGAFAKGSLRATSCAATLDRC